MMEKHGTQSKEEDDFYVSPSIRPWRGDAAAAWAMKTLGLK